ncbi:helix-turn-helix domain-containing protein [Methanopyrus sp.]
MFADVPFVTVRRLNVTVRDVLRCVLGLRDVEVDAYFALLERGEATVQDLAEELDRDRTTVQKALKSLVYAGLVTRRKETRPRGGFVYVYEAVPFEDARKIVLRALDEWYEAVKDALERADVPKSGPE